MTLRVMVFAKIQPGTQAAFESAFSEVTKQVKGTPGHISDELIRSTEDEEAYILLSEWENKTSFLDWENAPIHKQTTTPMRPYWAGSIERKIYDVAVRFSTN